LEAVRQNNLKEIFKQIVSGANINARDQNGNCPLHLAILNKNTVMLAYLIRKAPNLNAVNKQKQVPLHLAIIGEQHDMVLLLLESGCNVHARDGNGRSSICIANEKNLVDIGSLLVDYGANLHGELVIKFRYNPFLELAANFRVFNAQPSTTGTRICDICLTRPVNCVSQICGHVYCEGCIRQWLIQAPRCPFCNQQLAAQNLNALFL
jgi:hypothetical protein